MFKNNTIEPAAVIQVQSSSLFLLGNITIVGDRCYLGVIYAFHATVTNHGRLNISANQGIHYNVYFSQSKLFFTGVLSYSSNHGTFLMIDNDAVFCGTNVFSNGDSNVWAGTLTFIQTKVDINGNASFYNNSANIGGGISMFKSKLSVKSELILMKNLAHSKGGGVYMYKSDLICHGQCILLENSGNNTGGGIHAVGSIIIILGTSNLTKSGSRNFSFLIAKDKAERGGGLSLESYSGKGEFNRIRFFNNSAGYGGSYICR